MERTITADPDLARSGTDAGDVYNIHCPECGAWCRLGHSVSGGTPRANAAGSGASPLWRMGLVVRVLMHYYDQCLKQLDELKDDLKRSSPPCMWHKWKPVPGLELWIKRCAKCGMRKPVWR